MLKQVQHYGLQEVATRAVLNFPSPSGKGIEGWGLSFERRAWGEAPSPTPSPEGEGALPRVVPRSGYQTCGVAMLSEADPSRNKDRDGVWGLWPQNLLSSSQKP